MRHGLPPVPHCTTRIQLDHLFKARDGAREKEGVEQGHPVVEFGLGLGVAGDGEVYRAKLCRQSLRLTVEG